MTFKGSPSSQHQHCTDEAQKAETVLSAVIYIYIYIYIYTYIYMAFRRPKSLQDYLVRAKLRPLLQNPGGM